MFWGIVTSILYIQCGVVSLLVLPIVTLNQWQLLIHSAFLHKLSSVLRPWIYVYICLLTCCLLNSLRVMNQNVDPEIYKNEDKLLQYNLQQAVAQRNFYIASASIFITALARRLVLMKKSQAEEVEDFLNVGVEYKEGRRDIENPPIYPNFDQQLPKDLTVEPVIPHSKFYDDREYTKNWADLEEWSSRMRRITANLVREEKNNEVLKTCAKRLSNFCMRLDEDYKRLQNVLESTTDEAQTKID